MYDKSFICIITYIQSHFNPLQNHFEEHFGCHVKLRDVMPLFAATQVAKQTREGGALEYFLGGYVPPGTPNGHPVLKKNSRKIDTPFWKWANFSYTPF